MTATSARQFALGRKPNGGRPRIRLTATELLGVAATPPAAVDYYSKVDPATWGMDGNDTAGDCTCAEIDHAVKTMQVAAARSEVVSTAQEVLDAYSAITGYDPNYPSTDGGAEMQQVREYWRSTGFTLGGSVDKILLFAELEIKSTALIEYALSRFGEVGLGIRFPASAMAQFHANKPWDVVRHARIEGGHAIALVGYDADFYYVITWGRVQKMTPAFFHRYVEEAWVSLSENFVNNVSGEDPFAETLYQLGEQFSLVTGKPNPVPAPAH
jgi:hypothetical protein